MSAFGGKSGHGFLRCICPLVTQSGHGAVPYRTSSKPLRCLVLSLGGGNETARVHQVARRHRRHWPLAASAQQGQRLRRIGVLIGLGDGDPEGRRWADALIKSLQQLGWEEGENLQIDMRWSGGDSARAQAAAKELVTLAPEVISVSATPAVAAVIATKTRIPIVFVAVSDPVGSGFVTNFARPEGNVTGSMNTEGSIGGKWVELLKEVAPKLSHAAILYKSDTGQPQLAHYRGSIEAAGASLAVTTQLAPWDDINSLDKAILALGQTPNTGLIVIPTSHTVPDEH